MKEKSKKDCIKAAYPKAGYPEVRELVQNDREVLSALLEAFAERSGNVKLTELLPGPKGKGKDNNTKNKEATADQTYELIKSVMQSLLGWVKDEVTVWFMDLVGVTDREKYGQLPFDIEIYIIDQVIAQEGFNSFFSQASALYKKIRG